MCQKKPKKPSGDDFAEFLAFLEWMGEEIDKANNEVHRHKCPDCGHIWSHRAADFDDDCKANTKAHTCGQCGSNADACYKKFREKEVVKCPASTPNAQ